MSSHGGRSQDESFTITRNSPHFYKIILENTICHGKLEIPLSFVKKYGNCLSSPVILKVPTGTSWQVELLKKGEEIWLEKGWKEFSEHLSLKHGHLLVFQYKGDSHFNVFIFDRSAVEVYYPDTNDMPCLEPINVDDGEFQENEDSIPCQSLDDPTNNGSQSNVIEIDDSTYSIEDIEGHVMDEKCKSMQGRWPSCSNTSPALEADNNFISNYPSFKIVFQQKFPLVLSIPFGFVRSYMEGKSQTVMLQVAEKRWPVKLYVYSDNRSALISGGWRKFVRENSLERGDTCIFELIKSNVLTVSIFR